MKLNRIFFLLLMSVATFFGKALAQDTTPKDKALLQQIADSIIAKSTFDFYITGKETVYKKVDENNYSDDIRIKSPYNEWKYWNGVLNMAMLSLGEYAKANRYTDYAIKNYEFAFDNTAVFKSRTNKQSKWDVPFKQLFTAEELDDCGASGAGLVEVNQLKPRKDFAAYLQTAATHILKKQLRLADGTLARNWPVANTLWADDLYMGTIFLSKMGKATGDNKYFDDAILQVQHFTKYLFDVSTGLYYHCWFSDNKKNGVAHWGRCNGWVMMAQVELLDCLPKNHPIRSRLIKILEQQIIGVSRYQDVSGLWHQLLDKNDSYLETSCTAMFVYSIAKAVNNGWIDKRYASIAAEGWKGIKSNIQDDGQVKGICIGTGIKSNIGYYYSRPAPLNDIHGLGPVLLAGIEVMKMPTVVEED